MLRKVIAGKTEGKKTRGRRRTMTVDHLMTQNGNRRFGRLKQRREDWRRWRTEPAKGEASKEELKAQCFL